MPKGQKATRGRVRWLAASAAVALFAGLLTASSTCFGFFDGHCHENLVVFAHTGCEPFQCSTSVQGWSPVPAPMKHVTLCVAQNLIALHKFDMIGVSYLIAR